MTTPEGKVKIWAKGQYARLFPGHWRIAPRGGPFGKAGAPDDIMCWQGSFVAIEEKSDTNPVGATERQYHQLRKIQAAGGVAAVLRGKDEERLLKVRLLAGEPVELLRLAYDRLNNLNSAYGDEDTNLLCHRIMICISRLTSTPGPRI